MNNTANMVDQSALRFNQASIIILLALAFVLNQPWLVVFVAAVMWIGTFLPQRGLFKLVYQHVFKPLRHRRPAPKADDPRPHLFAQGVGALVLTLSSVALWAGLPVLGWVLTGVVVASGRNQPVPGFLHGLLHVLSAGPAGHSCQPALVADAAGCVITVEVVTHWTARSGPLRGCAKTGPRVFGVNHVRTTDHPGCFRSAAGTAYLSGGACSNKPSAWLSRPTEPAELAALPLACGPAVLYFTTPPARSAAFSRRRPWPRCNNSCSALQVLKLDAVEHQRSGRLLPRHDRPDHRRSRWTAPAGSYQPRPGHRRATAGADWANERNRVTRNS